MSSAEGEELPLLLCAPRLVCLENGLCAQANVLFKMSTVRTVTTTTRTTTVSSPSSGGGRYPQSNSSHGRSGGGRTSGGRSSRGGSGGCNCGGAGGGGLAAAAHWLALASAIIIIVAWVMRFVATDSGYKKANIWFEFLLFLFLALMVILGGFGIGGLDEFLEEYLQLTISMLGKGVLLILFCCRVYADQWDWKNKTVHAIASLLCCIAAVLAVLVLLVGLGVAK